MLPNAQDAFGPIPGLISCAGVTESVGITHHACATQMACAEHYTHIHLRALLKQGMVIDVFISKLLRMLNVFS